MKKLIIKSLLRPLMILFTQPALQAMALFRAYQYGLMYLIGNLQPSFRGRVPPEH